MRRASTWMLEKRTQTPSPSPDLIPAEHNNKTLTGNSRANWYIERGHLSGTVRTLRSFGLCFLWQGVLWTGTMRILL